MLRKSWCYCMSSKNTTYDILDIPLSLSPMVWVKCKALDLMNMVHPCGYRWSLSEDWHRLPFQSRVIGLSICIVSYIGTAYVKSYNDACWRHVTDSSQSVPQFCWGTDWTQLTTVLHVLPHVLHVLPHVLPMSPTSCSSPCIICVTHRTCTPRPQRPIRRHAAPAIFSAEVPATAWHLLVRRRPMRTLVLHHTLGQCLYWFRSGRSLWNPPLHLYSLALPRTANTRSGGCFL